MEQSIINEVQKLVSKGLIKEAFLFVEEHLERLTKKRQKEFTLLHSQYNIYEKKQILNIDDGPKELNKIIYSLLNLVTEQEELAIHPLARENKNEARMLFETNQELFEEFHLVNEQIIRHLDNNESSEDALVFIMDNIEKLLQLKQEKTTLSNLLTEQELAYVNPILIKTGKEKIQHLRKHMNLSEISQQTEQVKKLLSRFKKAKRKEQVPTIIIAIIILIAIIIATISLLTING